MLKRYTREELMLLLKDTFFKFYATEKAVYFQNKVRSEGKSVPRILFNDKQKLMQDIQNRIEYFEEQKKSATEEDKNIYQQGINLLNTEYKTIKMNDTIANQKSNFKKTKDIYATHTYLEIPLNKKVNALYDDLTLQVLFFDDLSNSKELIAELEKLESEEDKINFVKTHTEITHLSLQASERERCIISVLGKFIETDPTDPSCTILPPNYSDFYNTNLDECEKIVNNDLRQFIQEHIDMDKEDLTVVAEREIRGDNYQILMHGSDYYIRYVCPSTQRVYYNLLNPEYLQRSQYYKKRDKDSYILAWYSINNLFMELTDEVLNEKAIRC